MKKALKVIHLPASTGNNALYLNYAERKKISSHMLIYESDKDYVNKKKADYIIKNRESLLIKIIVVAFTFLKLILRHNIFHYNNGMTLTSTHVSFLFRFRMHLELSILKIFRKKIVVTFQGSDSRQADFCRKNYEITYFNNEYYDKLILYDQNKRKKIEIFNKYADLIYTINPDLMNVLPKRTCFRPYTKLDYRTINPVYSSYEHGEKIIICHAPTRRHIKGTDIIIKAINRLKQEGFLIEFHLIENLPNEVAMDYYKKSHLVIDQLYVGWYGGLAVESMALGKPVMCYIRESDLMHIPKPMKLDLPIITTEPKNFYKDLKKTILNKKDLKNIALKSREFIENWHDIYSIADQIINDYKNI